MEQKLWVLEPQAAGPTAKYRHSSDAEPCMHGMRMQAWQKVPGQGRKGAMGCWQIARSGQVAAARGAAEQKSSCYRSP